MNRIKIYLILVVGLLLFSGCEKFLEVDVPKDMVDKTKTFNDDQTAEAALRNVYVLMTENGFLSGNPTAAHILLACYTDELQVTSPRFPDYQNFYNGVVFPNNSSVSMLWNQTYAQLYTVNNVLNGLEESERLNELVKKQLKGEALALRGILHFYLTQTFGAVPYVTSVDYEVNRKIGKLSSDEVMARVIVDLKEAEQLLSSGAQSAERIRINKSVAQGFLARMYLYNKNYPMALQYAKFLLDNPDYAIAPVNERFLRQSKSAIWQLKPTISGINTYEAFSYIFMALPAPNVKLSSSLLGAFEEGDLRKAAWVKFIGSDEQNAHAFKYTKMGYSNPIAEYSMVMRIEEMYLIAAEAAANLQDWQACSDYLKSIRSKAGLAALDIKSLEIAMEAVLQERRLEFFTEFGHRFYDLKRTNQLSKLQTIKPNWKPHFSVLPLPENELLLNSNLMPQNTGY